MRVFNYSNMVLDSLGESLRSSLDDLRGSRSVSEEDVEEVKKEVQRALIGADVEIDIVQELTDNIKERALSEEPPSGVSARDHILNIVYDELVDVVGEELEIPLENNTILLAGLQGSGKTTSASKIAWWFSKKGLKPSVIQTDTFRPGSYQQAKQLTEEAEVGFYGDPDEEDPVNIARRGMAEEAESDVKIVDTAGRHALEEDLVEELEEIHTEVNPDYTLLVIDAAMGQGVKEQAQAFQESVGIDGVVITKMDGTAKGGGALTAANETDSNIAFIGTGEEVSDIERFEPEGFISRLLGMGDLKQLQERVERAQHETEEDWDPEDAFEGDFTLNDMKHQLRSMNEMGPLDEILDMIPGMGGMMGGNLKDKIDESDLQVKQEQLRDFEVIMDSMTEEELENPSIIKSERKKRIARGSGKDIDTVEDLLQQYNQMSKMFNQLGGEQDIKRMAQQMDGGGGNLPF